MCVSERVCICLEVSKGKSGLPVVFGGVFEQLSQLQGVLADLLDGREQEPIQRDVNHLLEQTTSLEEEHILVGLHPPGQLHTGVGVVVTVLRVDLEVCLLRRVRRRQETLTWQFKMGV